MTHLAIPVSEAYNSSLSLNEKTVTVELFLSIITPSSRPSGLSSKRKKVVCDIQEEAITITSHKYSKLGKIAHYLIVCLDIHNVLQHSRHLAFIKKDRLEFRYRGGG